MSAFRATGSQRGRVLRGSCGTKLSDSTFRQSTQWIRLGCLSVLDFNRNLPHMQPWLIEGRPAPCLYEGSLTELLHEEGLVGILNQTAIWLERAAMDNLLDPEQGWEPVRS